MGRKQANDLMRSAWATRRSSFEAGPEERLGLMERAREELRAAVVLCRDGGPPVELAQALHLLANVEHDMHEDDQARSLWEESVTILRRTGDALQLAHKIRHLGDLHRHGGRLADAEACYDEALSLYRAHDTPGSLDFANAVRRGALLKELQGDKDAALALWRETRELYRAVATASGVDVASGEDECAERIARLEA